MKTTLVIILSFFAVQSFAQKVATHDLKITVSNIKKVKGSIVLGIFNSEKSFLTPGKEYKSASKKVEDNNVVFTFKDLPKGSYAVSLFHDVNADQKCNLNFMGIPVEPYAFSNNFRPKFSKPDFKDCDILLDKDQTVNIKLVN